MSVRSVLNNIIENYDNSLEHKQQVLQSSLDESRSETSSLRVDLAKSNAQAEFHRKRYEHLVASAGGTTGCGEGEGGTIQDQC